MIGKKSKSLALSANECLWLCKFRIMNIAFSLMNAC